MKTLDAEIFGTASEPGQTPPSPSSDLPPQDDGGRRPARRTLLAIVIVVLLVAVTAAGVFAYLAAHKSVVLDVDGRTVRVTTFATNVAGLLAAQGVTYGADDAVTPAPSEPLREGGVVVVRYGHDLTVRTDEGTHRVTIAALDADEALAGYAARDANAALVPSRSGERADLPLRLDADAPVALVADGTTRVVPDGATTLAGLLDTAGLTLGEEDRIEVVRSVTPVSPGAPTVRVEVQRVETVRERETTMIPFEVVQRENPAMFADEPPVVVREGVPGERTEIVRVTTVDGEEESRTEVSDGVTREPVEEIVEYGTRERPEKERPERERPADEEDGSGDGSGDSGETREPAGDAAVPQAYTADEAPQALPAGDVRAAPAQCGSGGDPAADPGAGSYGLRQLSRSVREALGGSGLPSEASAAERTMRAQHLQQVSGWGRWPACSSALGLR